MADEEVLRAAELDLAVEDLADAIDTAVAEIEPANAGPVIKVLKGNPTDLELAALLSVFAAASASAAAAPADRGPADMWGRRPCCTAAARRSPPTLFRRSRTCATDGL
nr:acyl-CoA carboxylase subunit epsilon [Nocardia tengchongensis]